MKKTDEFILNRIKWKIRRYRISDGYTQLFTNLTDEVKKDLLPNINERFSGIPVLFFTKPSKEWTLVCTKQVIGCHDQKIFKINFEEIADINGYQPNKAKNQWDELKICDRQNNCYALHTNNGYDNIALHNVLLMCWRIT